MSVLKIEAGDHVHHGPTGEDWVVKRVIGDKIEWCGWPPGQADLSDCTLIAKHPPIVAQVDAFEESTKL